MDRESDTEGAAATHSESSDDAEASRPTVRMPPEPVATPVPFDDVFALLRRERRRRVLCYLADHDEETGPVSLSDLAEQIAAWEHDKPNAQLHSEERKMSTSRFTMSTSRRWLSSAL